MLKSIIDILIILAIITIPIALYCNIHKSRSDSLLFYSYIMSLVYTFHKFSGKRIEALDRIVFLILVWIVAFFIIAFFIVCFESDKEKGSKEYEKEKSDYHYLKNKEEMTNQERRRFFCLLKKKNIYEDEDFNFDKTWNSR